MIETESTLAGWLLARLDEDEQAARSAAPGPWTYGDIESVAGGSLYDPTVIIASVHWDNVGDEIDPRIRRRVPHEEADGTGKHIARHDPARVLADVAAKRWIVELHAEAEFPDTDEGRDKNIAECGQCMEDYPCHTLRLLALPYAGHDGYRSEWAP